MSRLIAFILGGAALAFYTPLLVLTEKSEVLQDIRKFWSGLMGDELFLKMTLIGPGVFVGLALILFAIRGKD